MSKVFKDDPAFIPVSLISEKSMQQATAPASTDDQKGSPQENIPPPEPTPVDHSPIQPPHPEETNQPPQSQDLEAIKKKAYAEGKLEAEQAMQTGLQQTLDAFAHACAEVDNLHVNLLEQSRGDMINLVIALSKKIIGRELTTGRDIIVDTLQNAIELAIKHNEYDIWLNPEDLSTVEKIVPELIGSVQRLEHITLKTDPKISRGGCKLDSSICTVDATIEAQLETAREFLEEKSPNSSELDPLDSREEDASEDL